MFDKKTEEHHHHYVSKEAAKIQAKATKEAAEIQAKAEIEAARRAAQAQEDAEWAAARAPIEAEMEREQSRDDRLTSARLIKEAKQLVSSGSGDIIVNLIRLYNEANSLEYGNEKPIKELINSYNPPEDKENIILFFQTLKKNKKYIQDFEEADKKDWTGRPVEPADRKFPDLWKQLNQKGDAAWDIAFQDYEHNMTDEEEEALKDIRLIKTSSGVEVLKKMLQYYDRFSDAMAHGTHRDVDQSPAAQEVLKYIFNHQAPTDLTELEKYASYIMDNEKELEELQNQHKLQITNLKSGTFIYGKRPEEGEALKSVFMKKIDQAIKTGGHTHVTTGAIGKRNNHKKKVRYTWIGVICLLLLIILIIILNS